MKKNTILFLLLAVLSVSFVSAQKTDKTKGKIGYKMKMHEARHQFLAERNVRGALNIYRALKKDFTNDAMINYRMGECYLQLKKYELAVEYFQNARTLDADIDGDLELNLGNAYHKNGQLDKSLEAYNKYIGTAKKKDVEYNQVATKIASVNYAKKMIASPVDVKIEVLGKNINSRGGDYSPSISADGKTMIFTSRRSDTKGGGVDKKGDFKYFEDIYISDWDSADSKWGKSRPIEGRLNTEGHDASLSISPDGQKIYIYRNDGKVYIGDIFVSKKRKTSGTWGTPKALEKPINSSYFESSACLSADGNQLYFVSERLGKKNGAQGRGDIYVAERVSKNQWGEPKNLGSIINTPEDEISVFIHPDGKTLFFSSKGHLSIGGLDIFMSKLQKDSTWSKPQNLGYPINSVLDDVHFTLNLDGSVAYYSAVKEDGLGERDIYKIDMSNYPVLNDGVNISLTILKGTLTCGKDAVSAEITFKDDAGLDVAKTTASADGDYFITLPGGKKYTLTIKTEGYKDVIKEVELPLGKGTILTQIEDFELEKVAED